ncbi:MAG TPA: PrsW family intramembrane metalloprotease [Kofleriaceae bacterium]|nr:PrsW family intramembrane metalloprotease [Kofleriaceae bacterium]
MGLLALVVPILPGLIWLAIFYRTDRYQPEPKRLVALTFALGIFSIVPAFIGERFAERIYPYLGQIEIAAHAPLGELVSPVPLFIGCFFVIGPCEEFAKFLAVRLFVYRHRAFDEPIDGIVYAAAAALGFASLENLFYVTNFQTGEIRWGLLGVRAFLALPGHVLFSATWGYALGRKKFDPAYRVWPMVLAAAGLHGLYDFLLMYPPSRPVIILYGALMVPVLLRQIRVLRADSPFAPDAELVPARVTASLPVTPPEPGSAAGGGEPGAGAT